MLTDGAQGASERPGRALRARPILGGGGQREAAAGYAKKLVQLDPENAEYARFAASSRAGGRGDCRRPCQREGASRLAGVKAAANQASLDAPQGRAGGSAIIAAIPCPVATSVAPVGIPIRRRTCPVPTHAGSPRSCRASRPRAAVRGPVLRGRTGSRDGRDRRERHGQDDAPAHAGRAFAAGGGRDPLGPKAGGAVRPGRPRIDRVRRSRAGVEGRAHRRGEPDGTADAGRRDRSRARRSSARSTPSRWARAARCRRACCRRDSVAGSVSRGFRCSRVRSGSWTSP